MILLSTNSFWTFTPALVVQILALLVASIALIVNFVSHKNNRSINTVIQLNKDFYQNQDFNRDRLNLWAKYKNLEKTNFKFDFTKILESIQDNDNNNDNIKLNANEIIALNRTVAFYYAIRILIKKKQIDIEMVKNLFGYNYVHYWNPIRKKLEKDSKYPLDKEVLKEIPELNNKLS